MRVRDAADTVQLSKVRMRERLRARLDAAATANRVTLNAEIVDRLELSLQRDSQMAREAADLRAAMTLMLGEDDAGLATLVAEVLRELRLRGSYLDDPAGYDVIGRGIGRLLRRLRAPADTDVIHDDSPEGRVDNLLWQLGEEPPERGSPSYLERWAAERRRDLGPVLSALLIRMNKDVRAALETMPPRQPQADPAIAASWDAATAEPAQAAIEHERQRAANRRRRPRK